MVEINHRKEPEPSLPPQGMMGKQTVAASGRDRCPCGQQLHCVCVCVCVLGGLVLKRKGYGIEVSLLHTHTHTHTHSSKHQCFRTEHQQICVLYFIECNINNSLH